MAYIPEDDENTQGSSMNVLANQQDQNAMQTTQPAGQQGDVNVSGGQTSTITPGQPQQSQPQQNQQTRRSQPKGSGMFTDIRKYIKANQGAGQRIGQAATKQFQGQSGQVAQQVQQQRQKLQQQIQANQQGMQQAQQFATQQITQAGQQPSQQQNVDRFRALSTGQERFDRVDPLNLVKQRAQAAQMQRMAQDVESGQGRAQLLKQTFGQPGQRYTAGQQRLDNLLLAGDQGARTQLAQGVRSSAQQTQQQLQEAQQRGQEDIAQQRFAQQQFQQGLGTQLQDAFTGVRTGLEQRAQEYNVGMQDLASRIAEGLGQKQVYEEDLAQLGQAGQDYLRSLGGQYTAYGVGDMQSKLQDLITARNMLGQTVEGQDQRQFTNTELARLAQEEEVARQRALEQLGGISDAQRTFLTNPEQIGQLQVGQYTGEDIGLLGSSTETPTFQTAREAALANLKKQYEENVNAANQTYYRATGIHQGYGNDPRQLARQFARDAFESEQGVTVDDMVANLNQGRSDQFTKNLGELYYQLNPQQAAKYASTVEAARQPGESAEDAARRISQTYSYGSTAGGQPTFEEYQAAQRYEQGRDLLASGGQAANFIQDVGRRRDLINRLRSGRFTVGRRDEES